MIRRNKSLIGSQMDLIQFQYLLTRVNIQRYRYMSENGHSNSDLQHHQLNQGLLSETESSKSNITIVTDSNASVKTDINLQVEETKVTTEAPPLLQQIVELAEYITKQIDAKYEPDAAIKELNRYLDKQTQEIWQLLAQDKQIKISFYKTVFKGVADKMLNEKLIQGSGYLNEILRFFRNIMVNFYSVDMQEESLAEIVHSIFNLDAQLYSLALQSGCAKLLLGQSNQCFTELCNQLSQISSEQADNENAPLSASVNQLIDENGNVVLTPEQEALLSLDQKRLVNELQWRNNLKVGDPVDCVLNISLNAHKFYHWMPGTVAFIYDPKTDDENNSTVTNYYDSSLSASQSGNSSGKKFKIRFDRLDQSIRFKFVPLLSYDLAKPGTFTDDFSWRQDLKEGDLIDCLDTESMWYRSTVLEVRETNEDAKSQDPPYKEVNVGYRVYEEEGHKVDENNGKKFTGWSHRYDAWIPVNQLQIQRLNSVSRHYTVAGKNTMSYDNTVADESDTMFNTSRIKCWSLPRNNYFSNLKCISDFVNEFGEKGGFDKILDLFNKRIDAQLSLKHICFIMEFLKKILPLLHRQFIVQYIPLLKDAFIKVIMSGALQQKVRKDDLVNVKKALIEILKRYYPSKSINQAAVDNVLNYQFIECDLSFQIACILLKSEKLEQRVAGLSQINDQIKPKYYGQKNGLSEREMLNRLREHNVVEVIFGEKESHVQLAQRGLELIKFLVEQKDFRERDLELVWNSAQRGEEQTKLEIYRIFKDIHYKFQSEDTERIVRLFANRIQPEKLILFELDTVSALISYASRNTRSAEISLEFFWNIATQQKPYPKNLVEAAIDKLINLVKDQEKDIKIKYLDLAYQSLAESKATSQCIRIMHKLIDGLTTFRIGNQPTQYEIVNDLIKTYGLINFIISDLQKYMAQVNALWTAGTIKKENIESFEINNLPFSHRSNIASRLSFIKLLLSTSVNFIQDAQLDSIWDILVTTSPVPMNQQYFFEWFQGLLLEGARITYSLIESFFEKKICAMNTVPGSFALITKAGFECIQSMFLQVNEHAELLQIIQKPSSSNNQVKLEFIVHSVPNELHGLAVMWKLLQECDKKNLDLTTEVVHLITRLYHNLTGLQPEQIKQIQEQFCRECTNQLKAVAGNKLMNDEEKKQFVKTMIQMIKSFLYEAEKNGCGTLRYHQGLERGEFIEKLIMQNMVSQVKSTAKLIEINVYSNMTIWELKKIISYKFNVSPFCIDLKRNNTIKQTISDISNHRFLRDMRLENYEIIQVTKKPIVSHARVSLLNKDKSDLVPEAKNIFKNWFESFSTEGKMNKEQCAMFIKATTTTPGAILPQTDERIFKIYNEYSQTEVGYLTEQEFLKFYFDKSKDKPEIVWSNLTHCNYGGNLRNLSEQNDPIDSRENLQFWDLPRAQLSADQNTFNELILLLESLPSSSQEEMWPLVTQLRTNPKIYSQLLTQEGLERLDLKKSSVFDVLYQLQIIDSFINEYQILRPQEIKYYYSEVAQSAQEYPSVNEAYSNERIVEEDKTSMRDVQAVAPESGSAIPLPPPNRVPDPPQIKVPFIGPQPANNGSNSSSNNVQTNEEQQKKVEDLLKPFKPEQIVSEIWTSQFFSDQELALQGNQQQELKLFWVQNFIQKDGFVVLMNLLFDLHKRAQDNKGIKMKGERECWNQLLKIIKVLLTTAFIKNEPTPEISLALTRRLSSTYAAAEETKVEDASNNKNDKNQVMQDHENTAKIYSPLIDIMDGEVGAKIMSLVDFKSLQSELLSIIQLIVKKKDLPYDEKQVIESAMNLWISCVIYNQDLIQVIFEDWNNHSQASEPHSSSSAACITKILVEDGLLSSNYGVRNLFRDHLKFLAESVNSQKLSEQPAMFFLKVLLQSNDATIKKSHKDSAQYYQLLLALLGMYLKSIRRGEVTSLEGQALPINTKELIFHYVQRLMNYKSQEEKGKILSDDSNLSGFIKIIHELISSDPHLLSEAEQQTLTDEIINRCLFTFEISPVEVDITKSVDISASEKNMLNKAQSTGSRKAAFDLLQTLCNNNPDLIPQIINGYFCPLMGQIKKPKKAGYQPRSETRSYGYCGLKNLGSICYMNSMMQQFYCIPTFRYSILSVTQKVIKDNFQMYEGEQLNDNMLHQFMKLMSFLELSERQDYNPREFCFAFKDFDNKPTNTREQKDTQEFLNVVFDRLEFAIKATPQKYLLQNVFGGETCAVSICKGCGKVSENNEPFFNLTLEVKNQRSIFDGLRRLTTGETISDYQCGACNNRVEVDRKTVVNRLPNTLILHLLRIQPDFESQNNKKLNDRVEFPNILNMRPYMKDEVLKQDKDAIEKARKNQRQKKREQAALVKKDDEDGKQEEEDQQMQQDAESEGEELKEDVNMAQPQSDEDFEYKLVGVVIHMGTADAGHYLSYININRGEKDEETPEWLLTEKEKWLEFNDSQVKHYSFNSLEADCYGGGNSNSVSGDQVFDYSKNAYMVIYEKRRKNPLRFIVPEAFVKRNEHLMMIRQNKYSIENEYQTQSQITLSVNPEDMHSLCPEICSDQLSQLQVFFDQAKNEYYTEVKFNAIEKFVPNNLYRLVQKDNHNFLFERQIFNAGYFEAIKAMLNTLIITNPEVLVSESEQTDSVFSFVEKLLFDVLSMTADNKLLIDITKQFTQMLEHNHGYATRFIERKIMRSSEESKNQKEFFENLVQHMDRDVREMHAIILKCCVNICFAIENKEILDLLMTKVFAMIPDELTKNWLKLHQYLWFLCEVTRSGRAQLTYMIENKLISKLIDFYLENESPLINGQIARGVKRQAMGSNYATPPLEQLILTISYIVRKQTYVNFSGQDIPEINGIPIRSGWSLLDMNEQPYPALSKEDLYMLSLKQFFKKLMKSQQELVEYCRLLCHISYCNHDVSRMIAKKALVGLNKAGADETYPYIQVLTQQLIIFDKFMTHRFEWILGVPQLKLDRPYIYSNNASQYPFGLKIGVENLSNPLDDYVDYRSTLFKTYNSSKESYLQLLFQYRKRWSKYALDSMVALFYQCLNDVSGMLYNYLYTMDPPTASHSRYLDWVRPHIIETIESCMRNPSLQSNQQEIALALQAGNFFDQLNARWPYSGELKSQQDALNQQRQLQMASTNLNQKIPKRVFTYDISRDSGAMPYLVWKITNENVINQVNFETITLTVKEYTVLISESQAVGDTNLSFPANQFPNYTSRNVGFNNNNNDSDTVTSVNWGNNGIRRYGRGSRAVNYQPQKQIGTSGAVLHTRKNRQRGKQNKNKKTIQGGAVVDDDADMDFNNRSEDGEIDNNSGHSVSVEGKSDEAVQPYDSNDNRMKDVENYGDFGSRIQEIEITDPPADDFKSPANSQVSQDGPLMGGESATFNIEPNNMAVEDIEKVLITSQASKDTKIILKEDEIQEEIKMEDIVQQVVENESNEQQPVILDGPWQENTNAVMVFTFTNLDKIKSQVVTLHVKYNEENKGQRENTRIPRTAMVFTIDAGKDRECLILTKQDPFEEWGSISWQFELGANVAQQQEIMKPEIVVQEASAGEYQTAQWPKDDNDVDENVITCKVCTLKNDKMLIYCDACGNILPK